MISNRSHDDWQRLAVGNTFNASEVGDPVAAARALTDWAADILSVLRAVSVVIPALADSSEGSLFWHTERLHAGLATLVTGGVASTNLTPDLLAAWPLHAGAMRDATVLRNLADEYGFLLYVLNMASGAKPLRSVAHSAQGLPYWHAEQAHIAVLTLLTGSAEDARAVHGYWSDNQEDTEWNLKVLAEDKRARSVVATVAADGDSAKFAMPDGTELDGGRMGDPSGVFWGADEMGDVVAHGSTWGEVASKLVEHGGYGVDTPVIVEYAADQT